MSSYTLPNPRKKSIYGNLPVSYPAGGLLDTVCQKLLQFDSIIAFTRYIGALEFIHVYTGGAGTTTSVSNWATESCTSVSGRRGCAMAMERFKSNRSDKNHRRRLPALEWFTSVLPNNK